MTPDPQTVQESTLLQEVAQLMVHRRLKRLPVVNAAGTLAGMVSRVDLLRAAAGRGRAGEERSAPAPLFGEHVSKLMRSDVPAVAPDAPLSEVLQAVVSTRLNTALVVDRARHVIGVVTDAELMDRMAPAQRLGLLRSLMKKPVAGTDEPRAQPHGAARAKRASDVMQAGVPQVHQETPLTKAIDVMLESDHKILAVVDPAGRLQGMVDRADLLRGLAATPAAEAGAAAPAE
jgi:CBS domain-containing protein